MKTRPPCSRDWAWTALLLASAALLAIVFLRNERFFGGQVLVSYQGETVAELSLSDDRIYWLHADGTLTEVPAEEMDSDDTDMADATHVFSVSEGAVSMLFAACPDQTCVHQGRIDRPGAAVVCLPYRLMLMVEGGETDQEDEVDAVTGIPAVSP